MQIYRFNVNTSSDYWRIKWANVNLACFVNRRWHRSIIVEVHSTFIYGTEYICSILYILCINIFFLLSLVILSLPCTGSVGLAAMIKGCWWTCHLRSLSFLGLHYFIFFFLERFNRRTFSFFSLTYRKVASSSTPWC